MALATERPEADEVFKAAAHLASHGFKLVRLYGIAPNGECGCPQGPNCPSPGKHPVGEGWQHRSTGDEDTIAAWFESDALIVPNLGLLLGEASGVIDVECDSEDAATALKAWGLDQIDTPAFRSGRGDHRLFLWEPGLPDAAAVKVDGIEVRLGGRETAAQSVMPPSWHASGFARVWLPGRSPEDCGLKPLPPAFRKAVIEQSGARVGGGAARAARAATASGRVFREGEGRHDYLYGEAVSLARSMRNKHCPEEAARVHELVLGLNQRNCSPPYPEEEVRRCTKDAIEWVRLQATPESNAWEKMGLIRSPERAREYDPGAWRLTIVHSDPVEYMLSGIRSPSAGSVSVHLCADEFMSPAKTAKKILATTTDVDPTTPTPKAWEHLWDGHVRRDDDGNRVNVVGLRAKLLNASDHTYPPAEYQRHALLASVLLDFLRRFKKPTDDDVTEPSPTGSPKWITHAGRQVLTFRWEAVWAKAGEQAGTRIEVAEIRDMSRRIRKITEEKEFETKAQRGKDGSAGFRFFVWDDRHISALEQIAGVDTAQRQ